MVLRVRPTPTRLPNIILYTPVNNTSLRSTPSVVKTLTMAPGGVETSVFRNTTFPKSANFDFPFATPGVRILKPILYIIAYCFTNPSEWLHDELALESV